jgi:hypothetical protein
MTNVLARIRALSFRYLIGGLSHTAALARATREIAGSDKIEPTQPTPAPATAASSNDDASSAVVAEFWQRIRGMRARGAVYDEIEAAKANAKAAAKARAKAASPQPEEKPGLAQRVLHLVKVGDTPRSYFENETLSDPGFYNPSGNVVDLNSEFAPDPCSANWRRSIELAERGRPEYPPDTLDVSGDGLERALAEQNRRLAKENT